MCATKDKAKVGGFAAPRNFCYTTRANISHEEAEQIRARIVCTPAESAWRGLTHMRSMCVGVAETGHRGWSKYADGAIKITLILLCSHTDMHPNLNREVRHSLTWHSSESESALERFEPVAVVQQLPDGRGSVFARVAARRQKVFKRGIDTYAKHVCRRRRDGSQSIHLFVLFVLFGQAKRTL